MMAKRNEQTSTAVSHVAAKWLAKKLKFEFAVDINGDAVGKAKFVMISQGEWREIRSCLASCLTQAPNKPRKRKAPSCCV